MVENVKRNKPKAAVGEGLVKIFRIREREVKVEKVWIKEKERDRRHTEREIEGEIESVCARNR